MTFEEIKEKFTTVWKQLEDFIPMVSKEEAGRLKRKGLSLEQDNVKKLNTSEEVPKEAMSPDEVHTEGQRSYWKITRLGGSSASYQFFIDIDGSLCRAKKLYEPDDEDQLWIHTQNLMHAPVEWKLYDTCGVHHVTAKDKEISMLVEKDYQLRKGLAIGMISYKL
uniref:Zinc finger, CCHC-type n=1 Tax=Tanacetum cinerariifolium TaxID=118510 RepID=A0A6L2JZV1_TANCI|nr:hypothetical protein [Tanacetum cinerariifolium]